MNADLVAVKQIGSYRTPHLFIALVADPDMGALLAAMVGAISIGTSLFLTGNRGVMLMWTVYDQD
jgi:hypothetical protein